MIIKDIALVLAKDPPMLKLVNLFEEISNMYYRFICVFTCTLWLYIANS